MNIVHLRTELLKKLTDHEEVVLFTYLCLGDFDIIFSKGDMSIFVIVQSHPAQSVVATAIFSIRLLYIIRMIIINGNANHTYFIQFRTKF